MPDQITTVTEKSWLSRIGSAITGVVIGLIFFVISFPLLIWNEGNSVKVYRALKEGAGATISADAQAISPANEGKLIHVTGRAQSTELIQDDLFGVSTNQALRLERNVEMFQWKELQESETEKKLGGGTTTTTTSTYVKAWSNTRFPSENFVLSAEHANPVTFPISSLSKQSSKVTLGAFTLTTGQIDRIPAQTRVAPPAADAFKLPDGLKLKIKTTPEFIYLGMDPAMDPAKPSIGDIRVGFKVADPTNVSLIAAQMGSSFTPYTTSYDTKIDLLMLGFFTVAAMFDQAQATNTFNTWLLRIAGFIFMFVGLNLVLRPLSVLVDIVPFIGSLLEIGFGVIAGVIASTLSLACIAIAWIAYRPVVGITLLVLAGSILFLMKRRRIKTGTEIK